MEDGFVVCPKCGTPVGGGGAGGPAKKDYAAEGKEMFKKMQNGSFWISGMKIIAWVFFALIIIGGLVGFIGSAIAGGGGLGLLMFIGSIIFAFLAVASIMIFLDMARDVSEIKNELKKQNN